MNVFDEIIDFDIVNICQRKKKESITQKPHHMHIIAWHFVTIDIVFCVVVFFTSKHITIQKFQSTKDANEFLQLIVYQMLEVLIQTIHWFRHTGNWEANKINIWTWLACLLPSCYQNLRNEKFAQNRTTTEASILTKCVNTTKKNVQQKLFERNTIFELIEHVCCATIDLILRGKKSFIHQKLHILYRPLFDSPSNCRVH